MFVTKLCSICGVAHLTTQVRNIITTPIKRKLPLLTLFTKKNEPCSLCDEAKEVLQKYSSEFRYEEQYIDGPGNSEWFERYRYNIPVIHLDGDYLMKHRVNEQLLRKTLDRLKVSDDKN